MLDFKGNHWTIALKIMQLEGCLLPIQVIKYQGFFAIFFSSLASLLPIQVIKYQGRAPEAKEMAK